MDGMSVNPNDLRIRITRLEGQVSLLRSEQAAFAKLMDERDKAAIAALEKALGATNVRLEGMNELRSQINSERGRYAERSELNLRIDSILSAIEEIKKQTQADRDYARGLVAPLQSRQDVQKGRDATIYAIAAGAIGVVAIILDVLTRIGR